LPVEDLGPGPRALDLGPGCWFGFVRKRVQLRWTRAPRTESLRPPAARGGPWSWAWALGLGPWSGLLI
jgi:hypothetical protein